MSDKILIRYFTGGAEWANRTREHVPRQGDKIKFDRVLYEIRDVVWIEDEIPERVHILIEETN
jgi:hypothetical protein